MLWKSGESEGRFACVAVMICVAGVVVLLRMCFWAGGESGRDNFSLCFSDNLTFWAVMCVASLLLSRCVDVFVFLGGR